MSERSCNLFEPCETPEAPLCPIQIDTIKNGIWYPGEQICKSKRFRNLSWIQKQHKIVREGLTSEDGFFTVRMLESIHIVTKNLKGADPDEPDAESKWFTRREEKKTSQYRKSRYTDSAGTVRKRQKQQVQQDFLL